MEEIWKDVLDYEGFYKISNIGRCKSLARVVIDKNGKNFYVKEKILKGAIDKDGYNRVVLTKNKISSTPKQIHRLVAIAFIENPNNYPFVLHKKESVPSNDCVDNLWWGTAKMNMKDMFDKGRATSIIGAIGEKNHMFGIKGINNPTYGQKNGMWGKTGSKNPVSKLIIDNQTGIFYESITEAANAKNIPRTVLSRYLSGNLKNKTSLIYA